MQVSLPALFVRRSLLHTSPGRSGQREPWDTDRDVRSKHRSLSMCSRFCSHPFHQTVDERWSYQVGRSVCVRTLNVSSSSIVHHGVQGRKSRLPWLSVEEMLFFLSVRHCEASPSQLRNTSSVFNRHCDLGLWGLSYSSAHSCSPSNAKR